MTRNIRKTFSDNLKALMKERGLSAVDLAKKADMAHRSVYNYLNCEKVPGIEHVEAISKVLGVEPWQLLSPLIPRPQNSDLLKKYASSSPETQAYIDQILDRESP